MFNPFIVDYQLHLTLCELIFNLYEVVVTQVKLEDVFARACIRLASANEEEAIAVVCDCKIFYGIS